MFRQQIMQQPAKYFTEDVMKRIDDFCKIKFLYGENIENGNTEEESESKSENISE